MNPKTITLSALLLLTTSASAGGFQPAPTHTPTQNAAEYAPIYLPQAAAPAEAQARAEAFRTVLCPEDIAATRCGYVSVPLDHAQPEGEPIELFVAVQKNAEADGAPLFYLEGGPGGASAPAAPMLGQVFTRHDVVGIDQRGIGRSRPLLACPEMTELAENENIKLEDVNTAFTDALTTCGTKLRAAGVPLELFNTTQAAADLDAVRRALGYQQVNLYGASYGTRLAQEAMRRHPEGLRAVVLDSVIPPQIDRPARTPLAIQDSLQRVFEGCAADEGCNAAFPNLEATYREVLLRLEAGPLQFQSKLSSAGEFGPIEFQAAILGSLYFAQGVAQVPALIYAAEEGNTRRIETSFAAQFAENISMGVTWPAFFTNECVGEVAYSSPERLQAGLDTAPEFALALASAPGISSATIFPLCRALDLTERAPQENDPVTSIVPTLLLAGEYDPVTPAVWLAEAGEGLSNSQSVVISGAAHGSGLTSECGFTLAARFLADPAAPLDTTCAEAGKIEWAGTAVAEDAGEGTGE